MSNDNTKTILVLGGTGHYGREVVRSLIAKKVRVRILSRNSRKASELFPEAEIVSGDLEDRAALQTAMTGVDGIVYAVSAMSIGQIRRFKQIEQIAVIDSLRLAQELGVKRIVYISVFEINRDFARKHGLAVADEKAEVEEFIRQSRLNWTILGAPPSMEMFFRMIRGNKMMVPGGGPLALPTISPRDVGEIVAQTVLRNDLSGLRIKMAGPEAYSFPEAADRISAIWRKKIIFRKIPMLFPRIAYWLSAPFCLFSDRMLYVHTLLGFVRLLNHFPQSIIPEIPNLHQYLVATFEYRPTTLDMEAERLKHKTEKYC